ncbi:MAG: 30S ribosomal protein S27ae [Thermoplasmataceae archaeon]
MQKREVYKLENNRIVRQRRSCPRCGPAVYLAEHENRVTCGRCGYMEIRKKAKE